MKIIIATFDCKYYLWQCLVQINNLIKFGYDLDTIYLIATSNPSLELKSMMNSDDIKCEFKLYVDDRICSQYDVSLRHHILRKYFAEYPEQSKTPILLLDPDVIFTQKINFNEMINDEYWHLSDTRNYIDSNYIKGKSETLFYEMCDIAKVSPQAIMDIDDNAGGAQYLMKNIDKYFWSKTYEDCERLYHHMKKNEHTGIQCWTADMWALLWNSVYFGHKVKINKELEFCWACDPINRWFETNIFHNAGIFGDSSTHFSKITYNIDSPFNKNLYSDSNNCSFMYIKEIKETENRFKEILF